MKRPIRVAPRVQLLRAAQYRKEEPEAIMELAGDDDHFWRERGGDYVRTARGIKRLKEGDWVVEDEGGLWLFPERMFETLFVEVRK